MRRKPMLDPGSLKALLRRGDPAVELAAEPADRVRRRIVAAASRGPVPAAGRVQGWKVLAATACALALTVGLWREVARSTRPAAPAPPSNRYQIDFKTPGGTRIVWTVIPDRSGTRRAR